MFTYMEIADKDYTIFKGYVIYKIVADKLSMTKVRGMHVLQHIDIPFAKITNLIVEDYYGTDCVSFTYQDKKYSFIYTGYGESQSLIHQLYKALKA
ncbi:hypothetical protein ACYT32_09515 [Companilactobacillus sp. FL22-3]